MKVDLTFDFARLSCSLMGCLIGYRIEHRLLDSYLSSCYPLHMRLDLKIKSHALFMFKNIADYNLKKVTVQ